MESIKSNYIKVMEELKKSTWQIYGDLERPPLDEFIQDMTHFKFGSISVWHYGRPLLNHGKYLHILDHDRLKKKLYFSEQENKRLKKELEEEKLRPPEKGGSVYKACEKRYNEKSYRDSPCGEDHV